MSDGLEIFNDGDGLAVVGKPGLVARFVQEVGVESQDLGLSRLAAAGAGAAQVASELVANSGRWIKLTEESAQKVRQAGLMDSKVPGVKHLMLGKPGEIKGWLQTTQTTGGALTNPAMLSGAAGLMAQLAMRQAMDEITAYLEEISEKLDDVLRTVVNAQLAELDAADLAIREAMTVRDTVGRVSEVSWSKVQATSASILKMQAFALRQLGDLTDKVERKSKIDDLLERTKEVEAETTKWLSVIARSFLLQDGMAILELDRVLDASPDELDRHRLGIKKAREERLEIIATATRELLDRMEAAADQANDRVLFNPLQSPQVISAANSVSAEVHEFHNVLQIESMQRSAEAARWRDAAAESIGTVREKSGQGVETAKALSGKTLDQAKSMKGKLSNRLADRKRRRKEDGTTDDGEASATGHQADQTRDEAGSSTAS